MRESLERWPFRVRNAFRKVRAGLRLRGENVSPEVDNDLFRAHVSVYRFFSRFADGRRALDLGCGAGYGLEILAASGAREVVGVDLDPKNVRYARRRFSGPKIRILEGDAQGLPEDLGVFELAVSSNVFEHLERPADALDGVLRHLVPQGVFALVVPPITTAEGARVHEDIPYHRANLYVTQWAELLSCRFSIIQAYRHLPPPGSKPDFTDPRPSGLSTEAFTFEVAEIEDLNEASTLGAVFVNREPLAQGPSGVSCVHASCLHAE